jgi:hypothetical protein
VAWAVWKYPCAWEEAAPGSVVDPTLADGEAEDVPTDLHRRLPADVVALV